MPNFLHKYYNYFLRKVPSLYDSVLWCEHFLQTSLFPLSVYKEHREDGWSNHKLRVLLGRLKFLKKYFCVAVQIFFILVKCLPAGFEVSCDLITGSVLNNDEKYMYMSQRIWHQWWQQLLILCHTYLI